MGEADNSSDPANDHQYDSSEQRAAIDSKHNSENAKQSEPNPNGEPTAPEAVMKLWKYASDEHHARGFQTILAILIFLATLYIAWVYSGQLNQMIESNRTSSKALRIDQRAWLDLNILPSQPEVGKLMPIIVKIANHGRSYAENTQLCGLKTVTANIPPFRNPSPHSSQSRPKAIVIRLVLSPQNPITI